jgi:hypothetical protein
LPALIRKPSPLTRPTTCPGTPRAGSIHSQAYFNSVRVFLELRVTVSIGDRIRFPRGDLSQ